MSEKQFTSKPAPEEKAQLLAYDEAGISALDLLLRESWLDTDSLRFDEPHKHLQFDVEKPSERGPTRERRGWLLSILEYAVSVWTIELTGATGYTLSDKAHIGRVQVDSVRYDHLQRELVLESSFPVTLRVQVDGVQIQAQRTELVRQRKRFVLLRWIEIDR